MNLLCHVYVTSIPSVHDKTVWILANKQGMYAYIVTVCLFVREGNSNGEAGRVLSFV